MGLGRLFMRSSDWNTAVDVVTTRYTATDALTGESTVYSVINGMAPDWPAAAYQGGMGIPGAWRAAVMLSDLLGLVPWDAWRQPIGLPEVKLEPTPPLLDQPNPPETRMSTFSSWGLDLLWHGNAVGIVAARNGQGWPTAALPVSAESVSVRRVAKYDQSPFAPGMLEYRIGDLLLGSQDVIHVKGPHKPGALRGLGILETHLNTLSLARDQARQARSVSAHGVPTGVLESSDPNLTDDEARDLKATWLRNQEMRTISVLNPSTKFTPISWNPEEMELIAARKFTLNEVELIFGLPVGWLGGTDSSKKYANMSQDDVHLLKYTLSGPLTRFEQTLSLAMPRGTVTRANMDAMLRPDTLTRYQAHQIAIQSGFLTVDEVREYEHRPPLPEKPAMPDQFASGPPPAALEPGPSAPGQGMISGQAANGGKQ